MVFWMQLYMCMMPAWRVETKGKRSVYQQQPYRDTGNGICQKRRLLAFIPGSTTTVRLRSDFMCAHVRTCVQIKRIFINVQSAIFCSNNSEKCTVELEPVEIRAFLISTNIAAQLEPFFLQH